MWEVVIKTILKKNKFEKAKWLPEEALKTAEKIREEKGKDILNGMQTSRE